MLENGTFFPFFVRANNETMILCGGNHRIESLIKLSRIMLIEKKFLVIFFPIEIDKTIKSLNNNTILFFPNDFEEKIDKNYDSMSNIELISKMRKFGSYTVWHSRANLIYPQIFNDEQYFEKWIKTPLPYTRFDIYRAFKDKME